ncbi:MAG: ATP-binding protein [Rhodocyclaceae bacterium]|nr:ATP-binding protein [Rhodocyclaceae bacterium]
MKSIRRRLLAALLSAMTATLAAGALATYVQARDEADAMFDYHLQQLALSLRDQAFRSALSPDATFAGQDFAIQVWSQDGVTLYLSHPQDTLPNRAFLGYATVDASDGQWRVFATQQRGQVIQVAQPMRVRDRMALAAALRTVAPFLLLLPVMGAVVWVVVGRGLRPLNAVARAVTTRTPAALDPLPVRAVPAEALPLVTALNDLLARLKAALEAQRDFVADAAHELRTPLAALQLQAQVLERAQDAAERADALAELKRGLLRASHSVQQLLTLARQEPGTHQPPVATVRLADVAAQVIVAQVALAQAKGIDLGAARADGDARIRGDAEGIRLLLANLVDNAIRYTPPGGKVDVAVGADGQGAFFDVCDSGPGIPAAERERVFDRFYRREQSSEGGSGLGLAIVKTIAARHGASVALDAAALGGLHVRVSFPP